jgi:sterol desaturase/sphingolipid hydroxylase (fatty acid hydroxylase superfamily)
MDIIQNETIVRGGSFLIIFAFLVIAEIFFPRRVLVTSKATRWFGNVTLHLVNTAILWLIIPLFPVAMALLCAEKGWGLLNYYPIGIGPSILLGVLVMDFVIYAQHALFHMVPSLWLIHRTHHTDTDFDVTTGIRFHPFEMILSLLIKLGAIAVIGPPPVAVLIFEILLNGMSMFNHTNIRISLPWDGILRLLMVTPDMHRVHHSIIFKESTSNFGFAFPWWDRLFRSYRAQPAAGHEGMTIGLTGFLDVKYSTLQRMLMMPFIRKTSDS